MKKITNFEIIPNQGLSELPLGMPLEEVINLLGTPDDEIKESDEYSGNEDYEFNGITLFYDDLELCLFFDIVEDNNKPTLESIELSSKETILYGEKIHKLKKENLVELITQKTGETPFEDTEEDFKIFELVDFDQNGISLEFDEGKLTSITIFKV